jgi:HlyD family secretion protein
MTSSLYRKQALRRFSSPERTDHLLQITANWAWLALIALATVIISALAWSIFATVPTNVTGSGIVLLDMEGTSAVVARETGALNEIVAPPGTYVHKGDVIARISMDDVLQQVQSARVSLANAKEEKRQLEAFYKSYVSNQEKVYERQRKEYVGLLKDLEARVAARQRIFDGMAKLRESKYVSVVQEESAREQMMSVVQQRQQTRVSALQVDIQEQTALNQRTHDLNVATNNEIQAQNQLNDLKERLRLGSEIRASEDGTVIQFPAQLHTIVSAGTTVALLSFGTRRTAAVIYVPATQGKLIVKGMRANVSPTTMRPEKYGNIVGSVRSVAAYPATPNDMMRILNNQTLVNGFSQSGPPLEVWIDLKTDPTTPSGLAWTSAVGPPTRITSGTIATANVVVQNDPPITLIVPFLRRFFLISDEPQPCFAGFATG